MYISFKIDKGVKCDKIVVCNLRFKKKELLIFMLVDYFIILNIYYYVLVKNC